jgi:hypothetical protein
MRKAQNDIWFNYVEKIDKVASSSTQDITTDNNSASLDSNCKDKFPIIVDYCAMGTKLAKSYKSILSKNPIFNKYQLVTAYKNHKNLGRILVRSELEKVPDSGAFRGCGKSKCVTCKIHASDAITSLTNKIKKHFQSKTRCIAIQKI